MVTRGVRTTTRRVGSLVRKQRKRENCRPLLYVKRVRGSVNKRFHYTHIFVTLRQNTGAVRASSPLDRLPFLQSALDLVEVLGDAPLLHLEGVLHLRPILGPVQTNRVNRGILIAGRPQTAHVCTYSSAKYSCRSPLHGGQFSGIVNKYAQRWLVSTTSKYTARSEGNTGVTRPYEQRHPFRTRFGSRGENHNQSHHPRAICPYGTRPLDITLRRSKPKGTTRVDRPTPTTQQQDLAPQQQHHRTSRRVRSSHTEPPCNSQGIMYVLRMYLQGIRYRRGALPPGLSHRAHQVVHLG